MPGCHFLDLFAGSGAIGIEALSRGAAKAVFVDNSKEASFVYSSESGKDASGRQGNRLLVRIVQVHIHALDAKKMHFDIIFMDPPISAECKKTVSAHMQLLTCKIAE